MTNPQKQLFVDPVVYVNMTSFNDHLKTALPVTGTIVARPGKSDAIGKALCCAFESGQSMPTAISAALDKLDHIQ